MPFFRRSRKNYGRELLDACRQHPAASPETVKRLLSLDPSAARNTRDEYGNTLLHVVCGRRRTPFAVIQALVQAFPEAVRIKDPRDGSLPLHLAVASHHNLEMIQILLASHPSGVKTIDKQGNLPLHLACATKAPFEVFLVLLQSWPEAVHRRNFESDALPLHGACTATPATFDSTNECSFEVIWSLLEAWPDAVMCRDAAGDSPYDLLKQRRRGGSVVSQPELLQLVRTKRALAQMPEFERRQQEEREQRKLQMKNRLLTSVAAAAAVGNTDMDCSIASTASNMSWDNNNNDHHHNHNNDDDDYKVVEVKSVRHSQASSSKKKKKKRSKKKKNMVEETLEI